MLRKLVLGLMTVGAVGCSPTLAPTVECSEDLRERTPYCFVSVPPARDNDR
jgi:hypothetical protein